MLDIAKLIIDSGGDVNVVIDAGYSMLMVAAQMGSAAGARFLIEHGADVNARSDYDDSALSIAANHGHAEVVELLRAAGATE